MLLQKNKQSPSLSNLSHLLVATHNRQHCFKDSRSLDTPNHGYLLRSTTWLLSTASSLFRFSLLAPSLHSRLGSPYLSILHPPPNALWAISFDRHTIFQQTSQHGLLEDESRHQVLYDHGSQASTSTEPQVTPSLPFSYLSLLLLPVEAVFGPLYLVLEWCK